MPGDFWIYLGFPWHTFRRGFFYSFYVLGHKVISVIVTAAIVIASRPLRSSILTLFGVNLGKNSKITVESCGSKLNYKCASKRVSLERIV